MAATAALGNWVLSFMSAWNNIISVCHCYYIIVIIIVLVLVIVIVIDGDGDEDGTCLDSGESGGAGKSKQDRAERWKVVVERLMVMILILILMKPFPKSVKLEGLGWFASHPGWGDACPGHLSVAFWDLRYFLIELFHLWYRYSIWDIRFEIFPFVIFNSRWFYRW